MLNAFKLRHADHKPNRRQRIQHKHRIDLFDLSAKPLPYERVCTSCVTGFFNRRSDVCLDLEMAEAVGEGDGGVR